MTFDPADLDPRVPGPEPLGPCRFCGDPVFGHEDGHPRPAAHPCCVIHSRENPGEPCIACAASRLLRARRARPLG